MSDSGTTTLHVERREFPQHLVFKWSDKPNKVIQDTIQHETGLQVKALLDRLEDEAAALLAEGYSVTDLERVQWADGHSEIHVRAETYRRRIP